MPPTRPSPARGKGDAGGGSIGIMGGTYDPVHNGHLAAARQLRDEAALEQVWLVPNAYPPHRSAAPAASAGNTSATSKARLIRLIGLSLLVQ